MSCVALISYFLYYSLHLESTLAEVIPSTPTLVVAAPAQEESTDNSATAMLAAGTSSKPADVVLAAAVDLKAEMDMSSWVMRPSISSARFMTLWLMLSLIMKRKMIKPAKMTV